MAHLPAPKVWVTWLFHATLPAASLTFSSFFEARFTQDNGDFFVAEIDGLTNLSFPGLLPLERGGRGGIGCSIFRAG